MVADQPIVKYTEIESASITDVPGFKASGVASGIKPNGKKDLALIVSNRPFSVAGVFTKNVVKGDSLLYTQARVQAGAKAEALLINSGNANACIGPAGMEDAETMAATAAEALGLESADRVLLGSTGVIGQRLPIASVQAGIHAAAAALSADTEAGHAAMAAIMTTDLVPKEAGLEVEISGEHSSSFRLAGMAKGSGMIHPNMATMIGVLTTDAPLAQPALQAALSLVTEKSFNRTSVDGDMSVCDMVLLLSSAENPSIDSLDHPVAQAFVEALNQVCSQLARSIARDGEGATRLVDVIVRGAATAEDAYLAALAIARSPLVKTAIFGADANWGRIITAAGYSGAQFNPRLVDVWIGDVLCCENGSALAFDEALAKAEMEKDEVVLTVDLKSGPFDDHYWTCDFSHDYVTINGSYRS